MSFPYLDREAWYIFKVHFTQVYSSDIEIFFSLFSCKKKKSSTKINVCILKMTTWYFENWRQNCVYENFFSFHSAEVIKAVLSRQTLSSSHP